MNRLLCSAIMLVALIALWGCRGKDGTDGTNGSVSLVSIIAEPSGTNCTYGGQKIVSGTDSNNNGTLDIGEITSTAYICNDAPVSTIPLLQSLYLTGAPASLGGTITAAVDAQSAQDLALSYSWAVSDGWNIVSGGTTSLVTITAPNTYSATGTATVTVTDSQNRSAVGSIALATVGDSAPIIESITIYPQPVMTSANLVASAYDQNGDNLSFSWTIGGVSNLLAGANAVWNSPGIPGYFTVGLLVSDGTVTISGSSAIAANSASPWPRFHRDSQTTGLSSVNTSEGTGTLRWTYTTGWDVRSSPAVGPDGIVYVGSYDKNLYAINPDGTLKWSYATGGFINSSPTIGADGTIYIGSDDNNVYAVNSDGSLRWSYTTGGYVYSSAALGADGTVYIGSTDSNLYAINPDGTLKWSFYTDLLGAILAAPAIGPDGTVYVISYTGVLYAISPEGALKWQTGVGGDNTAPAIGADGTLYIGTRGLNSVFAIDPNGTLKWSYSVGYIVDTSPAIGPDGTLYVGANDNKLYALDSKGTLKWTYATAGRIYSSPAIGAEGTVYVGLSCDNSVYAINANGTLKWSYPTGNEIYSSPAIGADGTIYIGSNDSKLYAIK